MEYERRYTLDEAQQVLRVEECLTHGHSWNVTTTIGGEVTDLICENCGWSGTVTMNPKGGPKRG